MDEYEKRILDDVQEYGWFCTYVFDPDGEAPSFAYTVGFTETLAAPEFIVFGLSQELMHSMLWAAFRQIRDGKAIGDGERWSNLIEGFDCISRTVHPTNIVRDYFNSAMWFWGDPEVRGHEMSAFQLVWPGAADGLFPWEPQSDDIIRGLQPPLYLPSRTLS